LLTAGGFEAIVVDTVRGSITPVHAYRSVLNLLVKKLTDEDISGTLTIGTCPIRALLTFDSLVNVIIMSVTQELIREMYLIVIAVDASLSWRVDPDSSISISLRATLLESHLDLSSIMILKLSLSSELPAYVSVPPGQPSRQLWSGNLKLRYHLPPQTWQLCFEVLFLGFEPLKHPPVIILNYNWQPNGFLYCSNTLEHTISFPVAM
jgi:hypothetical protein